MTAIQGEFCARCGAKSTIQTEPAPEGEARDVKVYRCPNGHGIQRIEELPAQQSAPPSEPLPEGDPTETATVQWAVAETDTDIALTAPPLTVAVGSVFLIDAEHMTVNDVSNLDNPSVTRGTHGSVAAAHEAGVPVAIWGTVQAAAAEATTATHATTAKKK